MEDTVKQHFDNFYNRLVFLDSNLGEHEKTFTNDFYRTIDKDESGKIVTSIVMEENLKDEIIYLRHKGLLLTLVFGTPFNRKYKSIDVYIRKDEFYEGQEEASIDELLTLLDEYIENNYKEFYEKINKVIFGTSADRDISIKYRPSNILSKDHIKSINISDATIKNKDIEHMKKYKNIRSLEINSSQIQATNIGVLSLSFLSINKSDIASLLCFDRINAQMLSIYESNILNNAPRSIDLNTHDLRIHEINNLNMAHFLLCTNFHNLLHAKFCDIELTPQEVDLLAVLYNLIELEAYGTATSFKFLDELPELESFNGCIRIIKSDLLDKLKSRFKGEKIEEEDRLANYISYHMSDEIRNRKKFWDSLHLSKLALEKYRGIIKGSDEEYIKRVLALPLSERQKLGKEQDISFIPPTEIDPFNILLENIDERYLSKIVGFDGKKLIKPKRIGYTDIYYILGPDGKVLESIEKTEARDVTVPEHYEEVRNIIVENENNIFDYYYNRTFNEPTKLVYLSLKIKDIYENTIEGFKEAYDQNYELIKRREELERLENELFRSLSILYWSPIHKMIEKTEVVNGEETNYISFAPDDFIEEDNNLYQALRRTRDIHILDYPLEYLFEEENKPKEEQERIRKEINELLKLWDEYDKVCDQIIDEDILVCSYVEKNYPDITAKFKKLDYSHWYLSDIESFLSSLNLNEEDYCILRNYILIMQCRNKYDLQRELDEILDREYVLTDIYSIGSLMGYLESFTDFVDYETCLKNGDISEKDYNRISEFLDLMKQEDKLKKKLDYDSPARYTTYEQMMPLIDNLSVGELTNIKEKMVKTEENRDRFAKFVDYLYFYFYQDIPPWIKLELEKSPKIEEKYSSTVDRRLVKENTFHIDEGVRIVDSIFANF